jgi:phage gp37-like protein
MSSLATLVEDAIIARLKALVPSLLTVKPFSGELVDASDQIIAEVSPALYTICQGGDLEKPTDGTSDVACEWALLLCVRNLRSKEAAARGQEGRDGAYDLIEDVIVALAGARLPNDACYPLEASGWRLYQVTPHGPVYQIPLGVRLSQEMRG